MKKELKYAMNLQHFAEDQGDDTPPQDPEAPSFEDILKDNPEYQKAFEAELAAQRAQLEALAEQETQRKLTAAEKLANMNEEERRQAEIEQREEEIARREREVELAELKSEARKLMISEGLPESLSDLVTYESADAVKQSVSSIKKAFDEAVSERVKSIAKGTAKPGASTPPAKSDKLTERNKKYEDRFGL